MTASLSKASETAPDSNGTAAAFSPREIVSELDRYIVGQGEAKRAVAIALRNRWRRQQLPEDLREEVLPKNILMIGPTGVGKTEIARRLAKLAQAPFIKIEATKFTEVGYVGRDVESIVRDLVEIALHMTRSRLRREVTARAELGAENRIIDALAGPNARSETREAFRRRLRNGELSDVEVELQIQDTGGLQLPTMDIPGMPGAQMGMMNLNDIFGKAFGGRTKTKSMKVSEAYEPLMAEESDKLIDQERVTAEAIKAVENNGIVFLDEIDKITARSEVRGGGDVSREGVQRDLLPLIEGTTVATKHGQVADGPHSVRRLGGPSISPAQRHAARTAGSSADPRRAAGPDPRRLQAHPDRTGKLPDPAVSGPDGNRGRHPRFPGPRRSTLWPIWRRRSTPRSRTSAPAGCRR